MVTPAFPLNRFPPCFRSVGGFLFVISEMSSCFVPVSLQVDHALCAAASYQHALGPDCLAQHTEHSHQPLLHQCWKMLWSNHHPSDKGCRQIEKHTVWMFGQNREHTEQTSGNRLLLIPYRSIIICIIIVCDYFVFFARLSWYLACCPFTNDVELTLSRDLNVHVFIAHSKNGTSHSSPV